MGGWQQWAPAIAGIVIGVVGAIATRRYGNRRGRLTYSFAAVPLVAPGPHAESVTVTVGGEPMATPHSVRVVLTNTGPKDVRPDHFPDSLGRFNIVGCTKMGPLRGELHKKGESDPTRSVDGGGGQDPTLWEFERVHIPRGATLSFTGVVDGDPNAVSFADLYDVDIRLAGPPRGLLASALVAMVAAAGAVTSAVMVIIGVDTTPLRVALVVSTAAWVGSGITAMRAWPEFLPGRSR